MSNWFTGKVGTQPQPLAGGVVLRPVPQQQQQAPVYYQQPQQAPQQQPQGAEHSTKQGKVDVEELFRRTDVQGPAARLEGGLRCPSCGSATSYTEYSQMMGQMRPAPHCYECGYNGKFQQGEQGGAWVQ